MDIEQKPQCNKTCPDCPNMVTEYFGQNTKEAQKIANNTYDARAVKLISDLTKSKGNFITDVDGNTYLDLFCSVSSIPLGYNHDKLNEINFNEEPLKSIILHRTALGINPPQQFIVEIDKFKKNWSPHPDLAYLLPGCGCGAGANENAFKAAFLYYMKTSPNQASKEEKEATVLLNKPPGCPKLSVLSFEKSFHGRTLGALSATRSKYVHKVDFPSFDWPAAPFPQLKYPLNENQEYNKKEEERCLGIVEQIIKNNEIPVAALIIEPIQGEGGDRHASPEFFKQLRKITKENRVTFIVDEVQTGVGATGYLWAHQSWNMDESPDIVVFSKKMQTAGYFCKKEYIPEHQYQIFNTWMGDAARIYISNKIFEIIKQDNLLEQVKQTGDYILENLMKVQQTKNKYNIRNVRGQGTFIAFDVDDQQDFCDQMLKRGINIQGCGECSVRMRPSLTLTQKEAAMFFETLNKIIN